MSGAEPTVPRRVNSQGTRVETGAIQFGEDWPGLFVRGDDAAYFANELRAAIVALPPRSLTRPGLERLARLLEACRV